MDLNNNQLTQDIHDQLKQGSKVEFKWHGSSNLYIGRIEIDKYHTKYFVAEYNYFNDKLVFEGIRYYNTLDSFYCFTYFNMI